MDIKQKANEYAQGKVTSALEQMIADAYTAGYTDGYQDRDNEIEVDLPKPDPEFVDLSLPSGTLWAADYLRDEEGNILYLTYNEAKKYNLPTEEQVKELFSLPHSNLIKYYDLHIDFLSPDGINFTVTAHWYRGVEHKDNTFDLLLWLNSETIVNNTARTAGMVRGNDYFQVTGTFIGYRLPVLVVKKKA